MLDHDDERLADLLCGAGRGDPQSFAELHDRTAPLVYGLVRRVVKDPAQAAEVTQDCYLHYWQNADRFDSQRGSVRGWMHIIAHRRAVDRVRSVQAATDRDAVYGSRQARHAAAAEDVALDRFDSESHQRENERVRHALQGLSVVQREAIELAYFGGHTYSEVAEMLDVPLGTAKGRLRTGLMNLRDALKLNGESVLRSS